MEAQAAAHWHHDEPDSEPEDSLLTGSPGPITAAADRSEPTTLLVAQVSSATKVTLNVSSWPDSPGAGRSRSLLALAHHPSHHDYHWHYGTQVIDPGSTIIKQVRRE